MNTPEPAANFYGPTAMQNNSANLYQMYNAPYQNLPNGQYTQNQFEPSYPNIQQQQQQPPSLRPDVATKPAFDTEPLQKSRYENDSNSGSSSDSDDSNNDSDSSSNESDAGKNDKENQAKMVVKPFRINLNNTKVRIIKIQEFLSYPLSLRNPKTLNS